MIEIIILIETTAILVLAGVLMLKKEPSPPSADTTAQAPADRYDPWEDAMTAPDDGKRIDTIGVKVED